MTRDQWIKPCVFVLCLLPLVTLGWRIAGDDLGANPIETLSRYTGDWTLRLLLLTLAVTPLRGLSGWRWPLRLRRMLGLYSYFYACLHFTVYLWLDQQFDLAAILEDIGKRPYITVGFSALLLMTPLALTSTHAMMRRLGSHWARLHRAVYVIGVLGVLHFLWLVKADLREPLAYAAVLALLLGWRVWHRRGRLRARFSRASSGTANLH